MYLLIKRVKLLNSVLEVNGHRPNLGLDISRTKNKSTILSFNGKKIVVNEYERIWLSITELLIKKGLFSWPV